MNIPFIDFSQQYETIKDRIDEGLKGVFKKGNFILGEEEKEFEVQFAKYCDAKYAIGVNSGTDALYLALGALDISVGDEVIIPTFTFIATALCISYTGAKPVFVDIEDETYNIDPQKLEEVITDKTKAIIPVHLYGQPANMGEIISIAQKHNIAVVEDACQAHGATYGGKKTGSLGDIGCFSFYPTKSLGAFGDGGIVVTDSDEINKKIQMLRDYGRKDRYQHKIKGYNSRLDTVQAVILSAKLDYLDQWNQMRNEHAAYYFELLNGASGITVPVIKNDRTHVFQTFAVRVSDRDRVLDGMKDKGIGVLIHYPIPVHLQEAYADLGYKEGDFPVSEQVANEVLSLPMFPHMNKDQIEYVCASLKELCTENQKVA
jgi:dTDP-4-amino-4,6-dideoxygalactose transaminase